MTTSVVQYRLVASDGSVTADREAVMAAIDYTASTADDTANSATISCPMFGTVRSVVSAQIRGTGGTHRAPQGNVTTSGTTVTVADTGLAVNDVIKLVVIGY